jgi:flagellar protein FlaI
LQYTLSEGEEVLAQYPVPEAAPAEVIIIKSGLYTKYIVVEPKLEKDDVWLYSKLMEALYHAQKPLPRGGYQQLLSFVEQFIWDAAEELGIVHQVEKRIDILRYYIIRDSVGYGPLHAPIMDEDIEEISLTGYESPVFVVHRKFPAVNRMETNIVFPSEEELRKYSQRLAVASRKSLTVARPILDARLGEHRLHEHYGYEVNQRGTALDIRKFPKQRITITGLVAENMMSPLEAAYHWLLLEHKQMVLLIGSTGSGKTSTLNAILSMVPYNYKIVSIEDTPELSLMSHPEWLELVTRTSFGANSEYEIKTYDLVKSSLRERPDIVVVGEVRGAEAQDLFQSAASVAGDTPVLVRKGGDGGKVSHMPIKDLVDPYYAPGEEWVQKPVDIEVLSVNGGKVGFEKAQYVLRHRTDTLYKIDYIGGSVKATPSHSVFVINDRGELVPRRVSELTKDDLLVSFVGSHVPSKYVDALSGPKADTKAHHGAAQPGLLSQLSWFGRLNGRIEYTGKHDGRVKDRNVPVSGGSYIPIEVLKTLRRMLNPPSMLQKYALLFDKKRNQRVVTKQYAKDIIKWMLDKRRNPITPDVNRVIQNVNRLVNGDIVSSRIKRIQKIPTSEFVYDISVPGTEMFFGGTSPILLCNTGHGAISSLHADDAETALMRLKSAPLNVPEGWLNTVGCISLIRQVDLIGSKVRRVIDVHEVREVKSAAGEVSHSLAKVFSWDVTSDKHSPDRPEEVFAASQRVQEIAKIRGWSDAQMITELKNRAALVRSLVDRGQTTFQDVMNALEVYYAGRGTTV